MNSLLSYYYCTDNLYVIEEVFGNQVEEEQTSQQMTANIIIGEENVCKKQSQAVEYIVCVYFI